MSALTFTGFMQSKDSHSADKWYDYLASWEESCRGVWTDPGMDTHVLHYMKKVNELYAVHNACFHLDDQKWVRKIQQAFRILLYEIATDLAKHARNEVLITEGSDLPKFDEYTKIANAAIRSFKARPSKTTRRTKIKKQK